MDRLDLPFTSLHDEKTPMDISSSNCQSFAPSSPSSGSSAANFRPPPITISNQAPDAMDVFDSPVTPDSPVVSPKHRLTPAAPTTDFNPYIARQVPQPDSKEPVQLRESLTYRQGRKRARPGDEITPDHIPSAASLKLGAELDADDDRTGREINDDGQCLMVTDHDHKKYSRTYGGRNKRARIERDAKEPAHAMYADIATYCHAKRAAGDLMEEDVTGFANHYVTSATTDERTPATAETNQMLRHYMKAARQDGDK